MNRHSNNHEKYISDCILSVLSQTYENWEMIIVDDGSTDQTYEIARSFAENDHRIKVFTQQNVGIFRLAETYNFALSVAQGKYIAILEGDDVRMPEKFLLQVEALGKNENAVFCYGRAYQVSQDLSNIHSLTEIKHLFEILNNHPVGSIIRVLIFANFIPAVTVIIKKDFQGAKKNYLKSIFKFGWHAPLWKVRSVIGLIFSFFHADIEGLAKKLNRVSYK